MHATPVHITSTIFKRLAEYNKAQRLRQDMGEDHSLIIPVATFDIVERAIQEAESEAATEYAEV